jgi:hypothetical protein
MPMSQAPAQVRKTWRSPSIPSSLSLPGLTTTVTTTLAVMVVAVTAAAAASLNCLAEAVSGRSFAPRGLPWPSDAAEPFLPGKQPGRGAHC